MKTGSDGRDDVLFDAPNASDVLGGDAQRPPLLFGLVVKQPEMHDTVPDDDIRRRNIHPVPPRNSARSLSLIVRSSGSALVVGALIVVAKARTRFALLTMPTSLPSRTTGTRLICLASSNMAISASSVVSLTETTSRVMTSLTVRACDLT